MKLIWIPLKTVPKPSQFWVSYDCISGHLWHHIFPQEKVKYFVNTKVSRVIGSDCPVILLCLIFWYQTILGCRIQLYHTFYPTKAESWVKARINYLSTIWTIHEKEAFSPKFRPSLLMITSPKSARQKPVLSDAGNFFAD